MYFTTRKTTISTNCFQTNNTISPKTSFYKGIALKAVFWGQRDTLNFQKSTTLNDLLLRSAVLECVFQRINNIVSWETGFQLDWTGAFLVCVKAASASCPSFKWGVCFSCAAWGRKRQGSGAQHYFFESNWFLKSKGPDGGTFSRVLNRDVLLRKLAICFCVLSWYCSVEAFLTLTFELRSTLVSCSS